MKTSRIKRKSRITKRIKSRSRTKIRNRRKRKPASGPRKLRPIAPAPSLSRARTLSLNPLLDRNLHPTLTRRPPGETLGAMTPQVKLGLRELEKILTFLSYLQYMGVVRPLMGISLGELNERAFDQWLPHQVTRLAGKKRYTRSAGNADFAEETGRPRSGNRCPRSGVGELTAEKVPNEPKWGYPLIMVSQRVNIDAFGVAYCKRTQFPIVRHAQRVGADSSCFLPTKPRAGRPP